MLRIILATLLICSLSACECCPETATGYSQGSCCGAAPYASCGVTY